jgi:tRNA(fMet)-specific endonuclease VapC
MFDTSVAIAFRDGDRGILDRAADLDEPVLLPILAVVELEGGVVAARVDPGKRRAALDAMYEQLDVLSFTGREAGIYRSIVEQLGFSRSRIIDRIIAAQAIVAGATLATLNPRDFGNIPGLTIEDWSN